MIRVLFVDDEPNVLEGLRDALRPQRRAWQMRFAPSGAAAFELLAQERFDVVVTDMRMAGIDGAAVLERARELQPSTARIVLSGQAERSMALRAARAAHLFLAKPCPIDELRDAVTRTARIRELLHEEDLRSATAGCGALPAVPAIYAELTDALANPDAQTQEVAAIVARDISMSAKVLQLVNSAFFGLGRKLASVQDAVTYLGIDALKLLVLSASAFDVVAASTWDGLSLDALQRHSLLVTRIAAHVAGEHPPPELLAAAMLHDVGKLVLAAHDREYYAEVLEAAQRQWVPPHQIERERRARTHAEIGAYLLDLWGLPHPIVEAVADHHDPWRAGGETGAGELGGEGRLGGSTILHIADALAHELDNDETGPPWPSEPLDERRLAELGLEEQLPAWREAAAAAAQELSAAG